MNILARYEEHRKQTLDQDIEDAIKPLSPIEDKYDKYLKRLADKQNTLQKYHSSDNLLNNNKLKKLPSKTKDELQFGSKDNQIKNKEIMDFTTRTKEEKLENMSIKKMAKVVDEEIFSTIDAVNGDLNILKDRQKTKKAIRYLSVMSLTPKRKEKIKFPSIQKEKIENDSQQSMVKSTTSEKNDPDIFLTNPVHRVEDPILKGFFRRQKIKKAANAKEKRKLKEDAFQRVQANSIKHREVLNKYLSLLVLENGGQSDIFATPNQDLEEDSNIISEKNELKKNYSAIKLPDINIKKQTSVQALTSNLNTISSSKKFPKSTQNLKNVGEISWLNQKDNIPNQFINESLGILTLLVSEENPISNLEYFRPRDFKMPNNNPKLSDLEYHEK